MFGLDDLALATAGPATSGIFSAISANRQMDFQERMASTSMQRRAADLQAAGLNPLLAEMNQQGAAAPAGAGFSMPEPDIGSAMSINRTNKLIEEQTREKKADADDAQNRASMSSMEQEQMFRNFERDAEDRATRSASSANRARLDLNDTTYWIDHPDLRALHLNESNVGTVASSASLLTKLLSKSPGASTALKFLGGYGGSVGREAASALQATRVPNFIMRGGRVVNTQTGEITSLRKHFDNSLGR